MHTVGTEAGGTIVGQHAAHHRHQEFLKFLDRIDRTIPAGTAIHAILDNYATHKNTRVRAWLAKHPRWTFHFTPTSCSGLSAVEDFFAKLTRWRLRHGVFRSVRELRDAIHRFIAEHNAAEARPFFWAADPEDIIDARKRGFQTLESIQKLQPSKVTRISGTGICGIGLVAFCVGRDTCHTAPSEYNDLLVPAMPAQGGTRTHLGVRSCRTLIGLGT